MALCRGESRELVDRVRDSDDLFFDSIIRVAMESWSHGRVVLIGDAADCISLLGEGSSMAIVGLPPWPNTSGSSPPIPLPPSDATSRFSGDDPARTTGASIAGHLLVPETRAGLAIRDAAFRTYATAAAARKRIRSRTPTP